MARTVAIVGANLKGNIGDFAILHATLADLREKFPDATADVYSHDFHPVDERRLAAFRQATRLEFTLAGRTFSASEPPRFATDLAMKIGVWPIIQRRRIVALAARASSRAAPFAAYDAVVVVGGAQWSGAKVGTSMFATLTAIHRFNKNIYAYPFSLDAQITRFNTPGSLREYMSMLRQPLVVRDSISKQALDRLGIPAILGADSVFGIAGDAPGIEPKAGVDRERVLISVTKAQAAQLQDIARAVSSLGREPCLMTTCWSEDEESCKAVSRALGIRYLAPETWQDAVAEIKASSMLITNRLHGLIFACLARTPALPLTNRQKSRAFTADAAMPISAASIPAMTSDLVAEGLRKRKDVLDAMDRYRASALARMRSPLPAR